MNHLLHRTGISPINWSNDDMPDLGASVSLEQCLSDMHVCGFRGTEPGHKFPETPEAMNQILAKYELKLTSSWFSTFFADKHRHQSQLDELEKKLLFLKACGASCINLAECTRSIHQKKEVCLKNKPGLSEAEWKFFLDGMNKAAALCSRYHIAASYHPHMGTVIQNQEELVRLMNGTDPEKFGLCLDTGHMTYAGCDSLEMYRQFKKRVSHIHFKDVREYVMNKYGHEISFLDAVVQGVFTVPGDGMIDFGPVVKQLMKDRYQGWIIVEAEQDPEKADALEYAKKSIIYLKSLYKKSCSKEHACM